MPFWSSSDVKFSIKLLFWNDYKCMAVMAQSAHESDFWESKLFREANNCFGMGISKTSKMVDGSYKSSVFTEPIFAAYDNVYRSVYDYYDYAYRRVESVGKAINNYPNLNYETENQSNLNYLGVFVGTLKGHGYFTAPLASYLKAVFNCQQELEPPTFKFFVNILYTIGLPVVIIYALRRYFPNFTRNVSKRFKK